MLITMSEAVRQFGVSDETLRRAIRRNQLQAIRVSGRTLFKLEDVAQWKERYYRDYRAKAVRVRWERQRKRKQAQMREKAEVANLDNLP